MKKSTLMVLTLSLFSSALLAADAPGQAVLNGNFSETRPVPANAKGIAGATWTKYWECSGNAELKDGKINLAGGVIFQFMQLSQSNQTYLLKGEIKAFSAPGKKGTLNARLSTCIRKDPNAPFNHSIQKKFGPFELTNEAQTFKFECKLEPNENGYLYIGESDVVIEMVTLTATPVQQ